MAADRPRAARAWIAYTVLRLLLFAVPFLAIWALSGNPTLSAVLAAVIGLALSVVLLDQRRSAVGGAIADRVRRRESSTDEAAEDRVVDGAPEPAGGAADGQTDSAAARPSP